MLCDIKIHLIIKSVLFFIEVLIYNIMLMLITDVQGSNSVIHLHIIF